MQEKISRSNILWNNTDNFKWDLNESKYLNETDEAKNITVNA